MNCTIIKAKINKQTTLMTTELTYYHGRNIFIRNEWKPFISKWFGDDIKFYGFESGHYNPTIAVTNWVEVKDKLPKSYQPILVNNKLNPLHPKYDEMVQDDYYKRKHL